MEFVAKKKLVKLTMPDGKVYEFKKPNVADQESLEDALSKAEGKKAYAVYAEFFKGLGLPVEAFKSLDVDDALEFIQFVLSGGKKKDL